MITIPRDLASASLTSRIAWWFLCLGVVADALAIIIRVMAGPWLPPWWQMGHVLLRICTAITFLAWVYDRYRSLPRIGWAADHTPFAAVAWFFVPLLNFYRPYLVVEEMWSATDPQPRTAVTWSRTVLSWWMIFASAALLTFLLRPARGFNVTSLELGLVVLIDAMNITAAIMAMRMIGLIDERWRRKALIFASQQKKAAMAVAPPPLSPRPPAQPVVAPVPFFREAEEPPAPRPAARPQPPPRPVVRPIAPPIEEILEPLEELPEAGSPLRTMRFAATVMTSLSIIQLALVVSFCAVQGFGSLSEPEPLGALTRIVVLMTLSSTLIGFIPTIHLMRFIAATGRFLRSNNGIDLEELLVMQGRFWRFIGAIVLVMLSAYVLVFVAGLVMKVAQ